MADTTTPAPALGTAEANTSTTTPTSAAAPWPKGWIALHYELTQEGQRLAFAAGLPAAARQVLNLYAANCLELLPHVSITADGEAMIDMCGADPRGKPRRSNEPLTMGTAPAWCLAQWQADEAIRAELAATRAQRLAENLVHIRENLEELARDAVKYVTNVPIRFRLPHPGAEEQPSRAQLGELGWHEALAAAAADKRRELEEADTRRREAEEARKRRQAEGRERMREWAQAHGSERLRLMLRHGFDAWEDLAGSEYAAAQAPEGYSRDEWAIGDDDADTMPTEEGLRELDRLTALCAERPELSDPRLRLVRLDAEEADARGLSYDEARALRAVYVDVTDPAGNVHGVARFL